MEIRGREGGKGERKGPKRTGGEGGKEGEGQRRDLHSLARPLA